MSENEPSNRRRAKRFLSPSQKYEIWLQLVRQEATVAEVASAQQVDRSTIMRIKQVAKEGALSALAASKPGVKARQRDYELEAARAEIARLSEACKELAVKLHDGGGKRRLGLSGRVPHRVDAATKAGLLDLVDEALDAGWTIRRACGVLELGEVDVAVPPQAVHSGVPNAALEVASSTHPLNVAQRYFPTGSKRPRQRTSPNVPRGSWPLSPTSDSGSPPASVPRPGSCRIVTDPWLATTGSQPQPPSSSVVALALVAAAGFTHEAALSRPASTSTAHRPRRIDDRGCRRDPDTAATRSWSAAA